VSQLEATSPSRALCSTVRHTTIKWTGTARALTSSCLAAWIFQIDSTLNLAAAQQVILKGGALAKNIVWVVAGAVTTGATSHFEGVVLAKTSVTVGTGGSLNGRILAQTSVALQKATIVQPLV